MERLMDWLDGIPDRYSLTGGLALSLCVAVVYALIGAPLAFTLFFLAPVVLVTFAAGSSTGSAMAIISAIFWLAADLLGHTSGAQIWTALLNVLLNLGLFLISVYAVSKFKDVLKRDRDGSHEDALTGIPNLRGFFELAERELMRARRKILPISIAYLGLDNFAKVAELHGQKTADTILSKLAQSLVGSTRATDVSARIGKDNFILLMSETGIEGGIKGIRRVQDLLLQVIEEFELPISFSVGLVTYNILPSTVEEMIQNADEVMLDARAGGDDKIRHKVVDL